MRQRSTRIIQSLTPAFALGLLGSLAGTCAAQRAGATSPSTRPPQLEQIPWEVTAKPRREILVADLDHDGTTEIIYQRETGFFFNGSEYQSTLGPDILVRTVNGDTTFTTIAELDTGGLFAFKIRLVDINGDGFVGLLTDVSIHRNTAEGWTSTLRDDEPNMSGVNDLRLRGPYHLNQDAFPDFIDITNEPARLSLGDGTGFGQFVPFEYPLPPALFGVPQGFVLLNVFDFNNDGLDDLALRATFATDPSVLYIAFSDGSGTGYPLVTVIPTSTEFTGMYTFRPADTDFPTRSFVYDTTYFELSLPLMPGQPPALEPRQFDSLWPNSQYADIDKNGEVDFVKWGKITYDALSENPSTQSIGPGFRIDFGTGVTLVDINSDGVHDALGGYAAVLAAHNPGGRPTFGRNRRHYVFGADSSSTVFPTDLNGDGRIDLVGQRAAIQPAGTPGPDGSTTNWEQTYRIGANAMNMARATHPAYDRPVLVYCLAGDGARLLFTPLDDLENAQPVTIEGLLRLDSTLPDQQGVSMLQPTVAVGDLDGDGYDEIIAFDHDSVTQEYGLSVWTPEGDAYRRWYTVEANSGDARTVAGDFDSDGDTDIASADRDRLQFFANDGTGHLAPAGSIELHAETYWLHAADLNNDGRTDLVGGGFNAVLLSPENHAAYAWVQPTDLPMPRGTIVPLGDPRGVDPYEIYSGDFNRDGTNDIAFIQHGNRNRGWDVSFMTSPLDEQQRRLWINHGSKGGGPAGGVADLDNDGLADLVIGFGNSDRIYYAMGTPAGGCVADVNHDSVLDLADITTFIERFIAGFYVADFNGDGILDLGDIQAFVDAFLEGC